MNAIYLTLLPVLGLGLATLEARAEAWPTKPLRAIVPVGAGNIIDVTGKPLEPVEKPRPQQVIATLRAMESVPSVTTKGGILSQAISAPLTNPTEAEAIKAAAAEGKKP